ncbi:hypothetical protein OSB04_021170 [Centaurea solstitialis]|uniref:Reverse transcriptase Ty1/copia-type domain-containing protein n=1 Tax=Centaurea solstitialis TaxID=347529 RepID=A0AA38W6J6_9ASTR|nr:hypothetical protein OSB04_021170 [Centaurea solstitialis]
MDKCKGQSLENIGKSSKSSRSITIKVFLWRIGYRSGVHSALTEFDRSRAYAWGHLSGAMFSPQNCQGLVGLWPEHPFKRKKSVVVNKKARKARKGKTKGKSRLLTSVSFMLGIANLQMHQMDVKIDLLNEDLEEIYMEQPKGFVAQGKENKVCKLVNTLYSLKQAPKQ